MPKRAELDRAAHRRATAGGRLPTGRAGAGGRAWRARRRRAWTARRSGSAARPAARLGGRRGAAPQPARGRAAVGPAAALVAAGAVDRLLGHPVRSIGAVDVAALRSSADASPSPSTSMPPGSSGFDLVIAGRRRDQRAVAVAACAACWPSQKMPPTTTATRPARATEPRSAADRAGTTRLVDHRPRPARARAADPRRCSPNIRRRSLCHHCISSTASTPMMREAVADNLPDRVGQGKAARG